MTQLRDARLRKAMDAAPDADLRPAANTREAIRDAARAAATPRWRRWLASAGRGGTPWAAALATVVLATLVVLIWEGRDVPGPRPGADDAAVLRAPMPDRAPAPAGEAESPAAPAASPDTAAPAGALPGADLQAGPGLAPAPATPAPPAPPPPTPPPPPPAAAPRAPGPLTAPGAPAPAPLAAPPSRAAAPASPPPPVPLPAPTPAPPTDAASAPQQAPARSGAAAPERADPAAGRGESPPSPVWTQVRIEANGRSVVATVDQAGRLPPLITRLLTSPSVPAPPAGTPSLRLELAAGEQALGVLETVGGAWRWTAVRPVQEPRWLRAEPALDQALRQEAEALLKN